MWFLFQVGQQNFRGYTGGTYLLLSGIPYLCSSLFDWNWWFRTHLNSEQKNSRILWNSQSWGQAISTALHQTRRMAGPLWSTLGKICAKKIYLWPFGNTCSRPKNISKRQYIPLLNKSPLRHVGKCVNQTYMSLIMFFSDELNHSCKKGLEKHQPSRLKRM